MTSEDTTTCERRGTTREKTVLRFSGWRGRHFAPAKSPKQTQTHKHTTTRTEPFPQELSGSVLAGFGAPSGSTASRIPSPRGPTPSPPPAKHTLLRWKQRITSLAEHFGFNPATTCPVRPPLRSIPQAGPCCGSEKASGGWVRSAGGGGPFGVFVIKGAKASPGAMSG